MTTGDIKKFARLEYLARVLAWELRDYGWVTPDPHSKVTVEISPMTAKLLHDLVQEGLNTKDLSQ